MLGRRVGNPAASASDGGNSSSWDQDEQQGWEQEELPERRDEASDAPDQHGAPGAYDAAAYYEEDDHAQENGQAADAAYQEGADKSENAGQDDYGWDETAQGEEDSEERALVPANGPQLPTNRGMAALARLSGEPRDLAVLEPRVTGAILVPGHGKAHRPGALGHSLFSPRARRSRPFMMHVGIALVAVLAIATTAFAMAPLSTETQILDGFTSIAGLIAPPASTQITFHWYVVHYGDSLKSIADRFGVLQGGILELNGLHSADDLYVGMRLKIPTSATYGQDFQSVIDIPIPPPDQFGNRFGSDPWNSTAGTTDPQNICAPQGNADNQADRQKFQLIDPNPNSSFARGFTWYHNGVDLDNPPGTNILAAQAGLVLFGGWDIGGLGWSVKINNCWGLSTIYGHMMYPPKVHAGDYVQVGTPIGQEGSTGNSTGPHLHFMTEWYNQWSNPYCFNFNLPAGNTPCTSP